MKKLEFINELGAQLHSMPAEEVRPLLDYYMEIVADRMEDGMTEEEAVASLGPILELAEKILAEQPQVEPEPIPTPAPLPEPVSQEKRRWTASSIVLAIVLSPLWLTLLCVLISIEIAVWATLASLVCSGIGCLLLPLSVWLIRLFARFHLFCFKRITGKE